MIGLFELAAAYYANLLRYFLRLNHLRIIHTVNQAPNLLCQVLAHARAVKDVLQKLGTHRFEGSDILDADGFSRPTVNKAGIKRSRSLQNILADLLGSLEADPRDFTNVMRVDKCVYGTIAVDIRVLRVVYELAFDEFGKLEKSKSQHKCVLLNMK